MQSIRSKIIIWLIRNRNLLKFQFKKPIVDETFSVENFRLNIEKVSEYQNKKLKDVKTADVDINGMHGEYLSTDDTRNDRIILYMHGGGFISGTSKTHRVHVSKFVKQSGVPAVVFDYRLAAEHPFPAALEDCVNAYRWLLDEKGYRPEQIVIAGESAGGTLTLSTLLKAKQENLPQPAGAVAISPATDLRCLAGSFERNAQKDIAPYNSWNIWEGYYIGDHDPKDPFLSPLFGNFEQTAPVYLCIGTYEIHYDDTINLHERVQESGGVSELHVYEKMVHAFPILAPMFPEATIALKDICDFIDKQLAGE